MAQPVEPLPRVPWSQFWPRFADATSPDGYRVTRVDGADHVTIIGPTRTGKSSMAMAIARLRPYVVTFCEKPSDDELRNRLRKDGFVFRDELTLRGGPGKVAIWPSHEHGEPIARQRHLFSRAMADAYRVGGWHTVVHEGQHLVDTLGMRKPIVTMLRMGASNRAGLILCTGRPAWMPRDIYSSAAHLFIFNTNDEADIRSIGGMNGVNNKQIRWQVENLNRERHEVLYVNTRTRYACVTRSPRGL